ncbi:class F sortase [Actinokineospora iranica]|uniref:Sortase family protein n=1 Tax=Actinokineospora iranica TaxID=1271860 RepID=A0A1G6RCW5_9PSEU|nr:class F sortase [Actinokineospora iranica]SDD02469.1 Sortase family protein [Actinokineospora iranica]
MAHRGSRFAPPAVAGGAGLLVVAVTALTFAVPERVSGLPFAGAAAVSLAEVRNAAAMSGAVAESLRLRIKPAPEAPVPQAPAPQQAPPPVPAAAPAPVAPKPSGQRPGTVRLAKGGTATLIRKELDADATLPVPGGVREATWWGAGLDAPTGATVFAGHVNWKGQTGPFAELWDAREGDTVSVVDAEGRPWRYRVSRVETVAKHDLPHRAEEFFGQAGPHRLVLVTCGGQWVGGQDGYESNRVVIAVPQ